MVNDESSPDPEISLRSPRASLPSFAGLALPSPLRELRNQHAETHATPHPSELTALAVRLRKIRLDISPTDEALETENANTPAAAAKPIRLDFDDHESDQDKENVGNRPRALNTCKPPKTPKRKVKESSVDDASEEHPVHSEHTESQQSVADEVGDPPRDEEVAEPMGMERLKKSEADHTEDRDVPVPPVDEVRDATHSEQADVDAHKSLDGAIAADAEEDAPEAKEDSATVLEGGETKISPTETDTDIAEHPVTDAEADLALPQANQDSPTTSDADQASTQPPNETTNEIEMPLHMTVTDVGELSTSQEEVVEAEKCLHVEGFVPSNATPVLSEGSIETSIEEAAHLAPSQTETKETSVEEIESHPKAGESAICVGSFEETSETTKQPPASPFGDPNSDDIADGTSVFAEQFKIVLQGKEKWSWPKRCEAMATVTQTLLSSPSDGVVGVVRDAISTLSNAVNANLDELRPSIITSALSLINSVLFSKADEGSNFAEEVFPSVMDLSCGRSLTAQEAARCVALVLDFHPNISNILEDADNPDRLMELLDFDVSGEHTDPESRSRAKNALVIVRKVVHGEAADNALSPDHGVTKTGSSELTPTTRTPKSQVRRTANATASEALEGVLIVNESTEKRKHSLSARLKKGSSPFPSERRTARQHRFSERVGPVSSSEIKATHRQSLRANLADIRLSAPLVRNKKLSDSIRKISPLSARKRRMYTEEDMEEARSGAIRVVMEETSQREAKARAKHQDEMASLERSFRKEKSEVTELKSVLEEYELTMQKMVAQGNSQASAYCASLEKETKKLKAELLEVTEAYESLKERYDSSKQAIKVYENKETRFIEQIRGLKKNMTELQKWSEDLKANCEKKLAKAFNQVTTFRASYMEAEAHRNKAATDLERAQSDLAKEVANHAETAAALSRFEASLHEEQDSRSSLEASLSSVKDSLARITSQKERLQREVSSSQEELRKTTAKLSELEDAETRATNASKQLETFTAERQSLKARAYDDLTRIRGLENELEVKDKEYQELNAICEEALSQLEKTKLQEK